jgi:hypothetical protein
VLTYPGTEPIKHKHFEGRIMKLNQIIAVEKGIKARSYAELTELNKAIQKPDLFNGFAKSYQPKDEDGESLPSENKRVQFVATEVLRSVERGLGELMEITARKDWTNCSAKADVMIDGATVIAGAPVSFLLFLEKQLTDVRTFVGNLPVLDAAEDWTKDANSGLYKTGAVQTHRTKKVVKPIVLYPATPEHPAQTNVITEDVIAGFWATVKQSGAMPKPVKVSILERIEKLLRAVKEAREDANIQDESLTPPIGAAVFGYLFDGI